MKVYTKGGDKGKTSIIGGSRISKNSSRVNAYGTIDELNSNLGFVASKVAKDEKFKNIFEEIGLIQQFLFDAGTDIAMSPEIKNFRLSNSEVEWLEKTIDKCEASLPKIESFIIPGGHEISSLMHICRTVTRRAERLVVCVMEEEEINEEVLKFLNRLSDYFFVAARSVNHIAGVSDVSYERSGKVFH
ncbi:cob(I)yrinic acid a,c-diamide adenosyltransferase [Vagococcus fessus]|uniref:Corrinoid adenosyltransferase n=1 Tax=Vagococcus fessus TaxID=120370 RepID=A0A430AD13_9ENTE|nr:cob(I)yrinic acid a,c-diamide adenosyltransferase [Vagococcus fessus]RSU05114.1 ATP:cob(I)alamin adenosyltransferase [Vagococcus fessus]